MNLKRLVVLAALAATLATVPVAYAYTSFTVSASSYVLSYNSTLQATAYASYHDWDCTPSYQCDRNVYVEFVLHRGIGTYSPIVGRLQGQTGQYGSSVRATFRLPSCRLIPRYQSVTYTIEVIADAPDGEEKTAQSYAYLRSCR